MKVYLKSLLGAVLVMAALGAVAQDNNYWAPAALYSSDVQTGNAMLAKQLSATTGAVTNYYEVTGKELGFQLTFKAGAACTSNLTVAVDKALERNSPVWSDLATFAVAASGTTTVGLTTNFTVGPVRYVRVRLSTTAITNSYAGLTNVSLKATSK